MKKSNIIDSKNNSFLFYLLLFVFANLLIACQSGSQKEQAKEEVKYTCPMHPQIIKDEPGTCPICGMDLVKLHQHGTGISVDSSLSHLISATNNTIVSDIQTIEVKDTVLSSSANLNGTITYNTNQLKTISARVSGRIEKLYVKYNFESVKKGQKLMDVYSPELVAIQQELNYLKANNDTELLKQAKLKLSLLGVSQQQINSILKSGKTQQTISIYSNYSGYLLENNSLNNNDLNTISENTTLIIKEGQYINTGDLLFKVFNDTALWADFYFNPSENDWLKVGDALEITANQSSFNAKIGFIQPFYKDGQSFKIARVYLNNNQHQFKIGTLLTATTKNSSKEGLWIPIESVYSLGENNIVFIKKENVLTVKPITIAAKTDQYILVNQGLKLGDQLAKNASYLVDTESFIIKNNHEDLY